MILDDFVMLGKTIPEPSSDGRIFVCSAGFSADLRSLVRIYPLAQHLAPRRWSISRIPVERNTTDSRMESFRIRGDRSKPHHANINASFDPYGYVPRDQRDRLLSKFISPSITRMNEERRSLAIIEPLGPPALEFEFRENAPDSPQLSLFASSPEEKLEVGSKRFAYQPYLGFHDESGFHRLQLRDWGVYEFMRKHGDDRRHELAKGCRLNERPLLLVGNQANRRTSWLVISVLFPVTQLVLAV